MAQIFGGIEGGSTNSRIVLVNTEGLCLGTAEGLQTNQWLIGIPETIIRLLDLVDKAILDAKLPKNTKLSHLGMALSGVDTEETQQKLIAALRTARPDLAGSIHICNDAVGAFLTATDGPALVLIAGTGSICKYIRPDLTFFRVGGYSYRLGDAGGAYYIAHYVVSKFLEIEDGLIAWTHDIGKIRKVIYDFFNIDQSSGLLDHFYENFNKCNIAKLCQYLAVAAREGEPLCQEAFNSAGIQLGRHVRSCLKQTVQDLGSSADEVLAICCGKVFLSWDLLQSGFREAMSESSRFFKWKGLLKLTLLQVTAGYGAARFAARLGGQINLSCPKDATVPLDQIEIRSS